jgi:hypothetical protein
MYRLQIQQQLYLRKNTTVARADVMGTLAPTLGYIVIPNGYTLKVAANATITAAKVVDVVSQGGDY